MLNTEIFLILLHAKKSVLIQNYVLIHRKSLKEVKNFQGGKAIQDSAISPKLIKDDTDLFANSIFRNLNDYIAQSTLSSSLKLSNRTPLHKI